MSEKKQAAAKPGSKNKGKKALRILVQLIFFAVFIVLILKGRLQLWFAIFAVGVILSPLLGRLYCGWACPMHTAFRPINWFYKKTGIKRIKTPAFLQHRVVRFIPLAAFLVVMVMTKRMGMPLPVLALLTVLSIIITLFFEEALWHNVLCPFGTILSITAIPAAKTYRIEEMGCISCGKCQTVCPTHAIDTLESKKRFIRKADCISCGNCAPACPTLTITYSSKKRT